VLASPSPNYTFGGWSGPGLPEGGTNSNPLNVSMDRARILVANFIATIPPLGSNDVYILRIVMNTNVQITATGTNLWHPVPWYSTNIMQTNAWTAVTNSQHSYTNGQYLIWFPFNGTWQKAYYRVSVTNGGG
jgi:hypothetical protein